MTEGRLTVQAREDWSLMAIKHTAQEQVARSVSQRIITGDDSVVIAN